MARTSTTQPSLMRLGVKCHVSPRAKAHG